MTTEIVYDDEASFVDAATVGHAKANEGSENESLRIGGAAWTLDVETFDQAKAFTLNGWTADLDDVLTIVDSVAKLEQREHVAWEQIHDYAGPDLDIGRYVAGEPECCVEYVPTHTPKLGKVVTVCSSIAASCGVSSTTIRERGTLVAAFILACQHLGVNVEAWVDSTAQYPGMGTVSRKVCVKRADEPLDVARILFAFSHPAMLRAMMQAEWKSRPHVTRWGDGMPRPPHKSLPEGTIYMGEIRSAHDVPTAARELEKMLRDADVIA